MYHPFRLIYNFSQGFNLFLWLILIFITVIIGCASHQEPLKTSTESPPQPQSLSQTLQTLKNHPDDPALRLSISRTALSQGDTLTFIQVLQPIALNYELNDLRETLLQAAIDKGFLDLAREMLEHAITLRDKRERSLHQIKEVQDRIKNAEEVSKKGWEAMAREDWTQALTFFRAAHKLHAARNDYQALFKLAHAELILRDQGQNGKSQALGFIEEAKKLDPDNPMAFWVEGDIYFQLDESTAAREAFAQSLQLGIGYPFAAKAKAVVGSTL